MVNGIVLLEGPDCTGKSTLTRIFKEQYGNVTVIHATNRWKTRMWQYHDAILRRAVHLAFGPDKRLVVLDRHWPSECVYGAIFRPQVYNHRIGRMFDRVLRRFKAQYVWCCPQEASLRSYLDLYQRNLDPDHPYDENQIRSIVGDYQLMWDSGITPSAAWRPVDYARHIMVAGGLHSRKDVVPYDFHGGDVPSDVISHVSHALSELNKAPDWQLNPNFYNLGGDPTTAKVVLVGDRVNPNKQREDLRHQPWPFHDPRDCSYFLSEQLDFAGIREEDICVTNSGSHEVCPLQFDELRNKRFVFLGNNAEKFWGAFTKDEVKIPHPSYAKRFKVKDYHLMLKDAINGH